MERCTEAVRIANPRSASLGNYCPRVRCADVLRDSCVEAMGIVGKEYKGVLVRFVL